MRPPSRRCSGVLWTSGVTVLILAFNTGFFDHNEGEWVVSRDRIARGFGVPGARGA